MASVCMGAESTLSLSHHVVRWHCVSSSRAPLAAAVPWLFSSYRSWPFRRSRVQTDTRTRTSSLACLRDINTWSKCCLSTPTRSKVIRVHHQCHGASASKYRERKETGPARHRRTLDRGVSRPSELPPIVLF